MRNAGIRGDIRKTPGDHRASTTATCSSAVNGPDANPSNLPGWRIIRALADSGSRGCPSGLAPRVVPRRPWPSVLSAKGVAPYRAARVSLRRASPQARRRLSSGCPTDVYGGRVDEAPPFVADTFEPPPWHVTASFVLEPLGQTHNDADFAAWSSSIAHIRSTPGFPWEGWPHPMTLAENLRDLTRHAEDFERRSGFTYTVLDPADGDVIGCVYIYPPRGSVDDHDAAARSWVRADRAELDVALWKAVSRWLAKEWPFERVAYAPRT